LLNVFNLAREPFFEWKGPWEKKKIKVGVYGLAIGERGIRTLGTKNLYNGLAISRFRPLSHLSNLGYKEHLKVSINGIVSQIRWENNGLIHVCVHTEC
jgi:hypothetical protein